MYFKEEEHVSVKQFMFSDCTINFKVVWSTQPAADKEGFP